MLEVSKVFISSVCPQKKLGSSLRATQSQMFSHRSPRAPQMDQGWLHSSPQPYRTGHGRLQLWQLPFQAAQARALCPVCQVRGGSRPFWGETWGNHRDTVGNIGKPSVLVALMFAMWFNCPVVRGKATRWSQMVPGFQRNCSTVTAVVAGSFLVPLGKAGCPLRRWFRAGLDVVGSWVKLRAS